MPRPSCFHLHLHLHRALRLFTPLVPSAAKRSPHVFSSVSNTTAPGRQDSASPEQSDHRATAADMTDQLNPNAVPFLPMGAGGSLPRRPSQNGDNIPSSLPFNSNMPPRPGPPYFAPSGAGPWMPNHPPHPEPPHHHMPPPPGFFFNNQNGFHEHMPPEHFRQSGHPQPWSFGPPGFYPENRPYGPPQPPPMFPKHPPPPGAYNAPRAPFFPQHDQQDFSRPAYPAAQNPAQFMRGANNDDIEPPVQEKKKTKKSKAAKANAKANGNDDSSQKYDSIRTIREFPFVRCSITKTYVDRPCSVPVPAKEPKKGRYGDKKIMLPAPQPNDLYLDEAAQEPTSTVSPPGHILVVLDLNGTLMFRPTKNAQTMIARPYLKPFLAYLFQNFKVMVWSSMKPVNCKAVVEQALDKDLRSKLVATWGRDTFGLSAANYGQNVQVYKNLRLVWSRDVIQQNHPKYNEGQRFGQHNTILIDDSVLKASAQPFNLLEIPEFEATPAQMEGDVLREVAGYLQLLRQQANVSSFIKREPFNGDRQYNFQWPAEAEVVHTPQKVNGSDKKPKPANKNKNKSKKPAPAPAMSDLTETMSAVALGQVPVNRP